MERIGIYFRLSTDEQAQNPEGSIKNQKQDCSRVADAKNLKANGNWGSVIEFYIDEGYSAKDLTSSAMGRALFNFAIQFAQPEREMTVERVTSSYRSRAERGLWIGGVVPFGLKKTERKGYLEVDTANQIISDDLLDILINEAGCAIESSLAKLRLTKRTLNAIRVNCLKLKSIK